MRSLLQATLLYVLSTAALVGALDLPTTVQFDLVFPRPNTVYKPTHPFLLVFAIYNSSWINSSSVTSSSLSWDWELLQQPSEQNERSTIASGGSDFGRSFLGVPPFFIAPVPELQNVTTGNFSVRTSFGIRKTCDEKGHIPAEQTLDVFSHDRLYFGLDSENGKEPDITAARCPWTIGAIGIEKEVLRDYDHTRADEKCLVLKTGLQPTQECVVELTKEIADRIAEESKVAADPCSEWSLQEWPRSLWAHVGNGCPQWKSESSSISIANTCAVVFLALATVAVGL